MYETHAATRVAILPNDIRDRDRVHAKSLRMIWIQDAVVWEIPLDKPETKPRKWTSSLRPKRFEGECSMEAAG
jgi:hypothetical protein